jgi:NADPH:quinone reductase-like Zn-dependent oxidoreductase
VANGSGVVVVVLLRLGGVVVLKVIRIVRPQPGTASTSTRPPWARRRSAIGATPVEYGDGLVDRVRAVAPQGIDAVYDTAGQGALPDSIELRGGTDRIVTIADMSGGELGVSVSYGGTPPEVSAAGLTEQLQLIADGKLSVRIADTFALTDAAKAQELSESGHAKGKLIIVP